MPELPEAEITLRKLQAIVGKTIVGFWSDWPRGLRLTRTPRRIARDITRRKILKLRRHGKVLFFELSGERVIAFHLRMSGRLVIKSKLLNASKHVHCKLLFNDGSELWFEDPRKFGVVWYGTQEETAKDPYLAALGSDALGISFEEFRARLLGHKGAIKPLLLRQDVFTGIGNIIADETLWEAKIHPKRLIPTLTAGEVRSLYDALKEVLRRAIKAEGTTIRSWSHPDGQAGRFQDYMRVYGKKGKACPRCKTSIVRIEVGGRGTWVCTRCQECH